MRRRSRRPARLLLLIPFFGLIFWITAVLASGLPGLFVLGVNVHGLTLASYAGDAGVALAPLSPRIIDDVNRNPISGKAPSASARPGVTATIAPAASPTVRPTAVSTPSATPTPSPKPKPSATPGPSVSPLPTPLPSIVPTSTPAPLPLPSGLPIPPILPSLLPGLFR